MASLEDSIKKWILEDCGNDLSRIDLAIQNRIRGIHYWYRVKAWAENRKEFLNWSKIDELLQAHGFQKVLPRISDKIKNDPQKGYELAQKINIDGAIVSKIRTGKLKDLRVSSVFQICDALKIEIFLPCPLKKK